MPRVRKKQPSRWKSKTCHTHTLLLGRWWRKEWIFASCRSPPSRVGARHTYTYRSCILYLKICRSWVCVCVSPAREPRKEPNSAQSRITDGRKRETHVLSMYTLCVCMQTRKRNGRGISSYSSRSSEKSRIQSHTPHTLAPLTKNIFEGQTIIIMKLLSALLLSFSVLLGTFHLGKTTTVVLAQEDQQDRHLRWFHRKKKEAPKKKKHDYKPPHYMDVQNVGKWECASIYMVGII